MNLVSVILFIIIFINISAYIIHQNIYNLLPQKERQRRNSFMKNYYSSIIINLSILLIIACIIFNITNFDITYNLLGIFYDTFFVLIINDTWFYWLHRLFHENNFLRRTIHGEHHLSIRPLPLDYIYAHPLEIIFGFIGMILPLFIKTINLYGYLIASILRNFHEIEIHTSKNNYSIIPFFNPPNKHYIHHSVTRNCNYASMFPFWDNLMGTNNNSTE